VNIFWFSDKKVEKFQENKVNYFLSGIENNRLYFSENLTKYWLVKAYYLRYNYSSELRSRWLFMGRSELCSGWL